MNPAIFPIKHRDKIPITPNGFKDATKDPAIIEKWKLAHPGCNWGFPTGEVNGFIVLDIDPRNGGDETLRDLVAKHGPLPETVMCVTGGGGMHYYFKHPGKPVKCANNLNGWAGIDLKADGGYVVGPPSIHASGKAYAWELMHHPEETPMAEAPAWLLNGHEKPVVSVPSVVSTGKVISGNRNATLTSKAGTMRKAGFNLLAIRKAIAEYNAEACNPPLDDAEVEKIATSVARYAPAEEAAAKADRYVGSSYTMAEIMAKDLPPIPSLLPDGLLPLGAYAVIHGPEGYGKTWLALELGLAVALGEKWLDIECQRGRVVYIGSEMNEHMAKARAHIINKLATPQGQAPLPGTDDFIFFTAPMFMEMPDIADPLEADLLAETCLGLEAKLLILDPWSDFHSLNENDNTDMAKVVKNLRRITDKGISVLLIHHDRKPGQGNEPDNVRGRMRGAIKVRTSAKTVMSLSEEQGHLKLEFAKVSCGSGREEIWLSEADGGGYVVGPAPVDLVVQRKDRISEVYFIIQKSHPTPLLRSEIKEKLSFKCADRTMKDYLKFLCNDKIKRHGDDKHSVYGLLLEAE